MHEQSHTVVRLAVHLPDQQQVYFTNDNAAEVLMHAELKSTTLIGWLNLITINKLNVHKVISKHLCIMFGMGSNGKNELNISQSLAECTMYHLKNGII